MWRSSIVVNNPVEIAPFGSAEWNDSVNIYVNKHYVAAGQIFM